MPKRIKKVLTFNKHKNKWKDCTDCDLCHTRKKVVFGRGKIPCDILFIGEAPGRGEDVIGQAFVGPAGIELDDEIRNAIERCGLQEDPRIAFTNLVACMPLNEEGNKNSAPPKESIKACNDRLIEFIELSKPGAIIAAGDLPYKSLTNNDWVIKHKMQKILYKITHPARILRADITQKGMMRQRNIIVIQDVIEDLLNG